MVILVSRGLDNRDGPDYELLEGVIESRLLMLD